MVDPVESGSDSLLHSDWFLLLHTRVHPGRCWSSSPFKTELVALSSPIALTPALPSSSLSLPISPHCSSPARSLVAWRQPPVPSAKGRVQMPRFKIRTGREGTKPYLALFSPLQLPQWRLISHHALALPLKTSSRQPIVSNCTSSSSSIIEASRSGFDLLSLTPNE